MKPQSSFWWATKTMFFCLLIAQSLISCTNQEHMNNPLLQDFKTPFETPPFEEITNAHYLPAFKEAMKQGRAEIDKIINLTDAPTFANTIEALDGSGKLLNRISSIFFNLNSAETSDSIQAIAREVSPLLSEYSNDIALNEKLFERVKKVYDQKESLQLTPEQNMLLEDTYKGFVRQGALLSGDAKKRYREVTSELSQVSLAFGENVLAETNDYKLHITNKEDLSGIPDQFVEDAAALAKKEEKEGWIFTLQAPSYIPFMQYADNRELREKLFKAYALRSNNNNARDNKENVLRLAHLRLEKANLLGYDSHADYVLEERMAESAETVHSFLDELFEKAYPFAQNDVKDVAKFAKSLGFKEELQRWDFSYYSDKLKTSRFSLTDEMIRPYFQLEKVKAGIFDLTHKLYGLTYKRNTDIQLYHPDVEAYEVFDEGGSHLAVLYLDFFPRSSKQGGAWMTSYRGQHKVNDEDVRPHISVVCNFTPPSENRPSLLTFTEVTTFLHEFGHALHGMLSEVTYESQSGTSVYRDFVELPSQIMENWATEEEWLNNVAVHYQTNEPIPSDMVKNIIDANKFQSGYFTVRQLSFGFTDMAWHAITDSIKTDVIGFEKAAMEKTELFPEVEGTAMSPAFSHIFNGGYAAGYYGYKWAEVLDADAFALFKENGIYDKTTAASFRHNILSKGGTEHPMTLYINFKGSEPTNEALLVRSGLVK